MSKPFDYSKWDNIELSDDESDLHPNIDKDSWFRLKHRTRLEREEKEDQEIEQYKKLDAEDLARINVIKARLNGIKAGETGDEDAEFEDVEALEVEMKELEKLIETRRKRTLEIQERRKWNIDNICRVKDEKTIINTSATTKSLEAEINLNDISDSEDEATPATTTTSSPATSSPATSAPTSTPSSASSSASSSSASSSSSSSSASVPASVPASSSSVVGPAVSKTTLKKEKAAILSYNDYVIKHEKILETYSEIQDMEKTKEYLFHNCDVLLHEHSQNYLLLSCLEDEMNGKHSRMRLVCRQSQILSHIQELGKSMRRDPRDVILPFFKKIEEPENLAQFLKAVTDFTMKVQNRAIEKRKEMEAEEAEEDDEYEYDGEDPNIVGPGGLNPYQVLKQLPPKLRKAFESQDIPLLQQVLAEMNPQEAKKYMKMCVDSGLWVAKDNSVYEDDESNNQDELINQDEEEID